MELAVTRFFAFLRLKLLISLFRDIAPFALLRFSDIIFTLTGFGRIWYISRINITAPVTVTIHVQSMFRYFEKLEFNKDMKIFLQIFYFDPALRYFDIDVQQLMKHLIWFIKQ